MWLKCSLCSKNCFFSLLSAIFFELSITRTPDNSNRFSISFEVSSYRESPVEQTFRIWFWCCSLCSYLFFLYVMKIRQKILFPVLNCSHRIGKTLKKLLCLNCVYHTERRRTRKCESSIVLTSIEQAIVSPYLVCKFLCLN